MALKGIFSVTKYRKEKTVLIRNVWAPFHGFLLFNKISNKIFDFLVSYHDGYGIFCGTRVPDCPGVVGYHNWSLCRRSFMNTFSLFLLDCLTSALNDFMNSHETVYSPSIDHLECNK